MKKIDLTQFVRVDLKNFQEYKAVDSAYDLSVKNRTPIEKVVKLDAGENLYGPFDFITNALSQFKGYQFYPDPEYKRLRGAIGKYVGVSQEFIAVGRGGDELIDLILRSVLEKGDKIIDCPPTFSSYSISSVLNRGVIINILRKKDFSIDTAKIIEAIDNKVKIIFICNPNNPTGNITPLKDIKKILDTGKLVCVDEAYIEFGGKTVQSLILQYNNLIILRSFSKWAGIAGLRPGYALMSPYFVNIIMKIKQTYNVDAAAEIAGLAVLENINFFKKITKIIIKERERMYEELSKLKKIIIYPSKGNFLFLQTKSNNLQKLRNIFEKNRIYLRYYNSPLTGCAIRITIGKREQNNKILKIFKSYDPSIKLRVILSEIEI